MLQYLFDIVLLKSDIKLMVILSQNLDQFHFRWLKIKVIYAATKGYFGNVIFEPSKIKPVLE